MAQHHELPYRYEFAIDELAEIKACTYTHGFALVKGMLPPGLVEQLKHSVREVLEPLSRDTITYTMADFIEYSDALAGLITYEPYMRIARALYDDPDLTLNRSAAIYKKPGCGPHVLHTDWEPLEGVYGANAVLNNSGACSNWFYLNGLHPDRGGLALIPDSHTEDWPGPAGFELTGQRRSFRRIGTDTMYYDRFDFPEVFPLYADPGDMVIFAERTYHGVFPHNGSEPRLSCGLSFRPGRSGFPDCWPPSESTKRFIASRPPEVRPLVEHYTGHSASWRSGRA